MFSTKGLLSVKDNGHITSFWGIKANSSDPDHAPHNAVSGQAIKCLLIKGSQCYGYQTHTRAVSSKCILMNLQMIIAKWVINL